MHDVPASGAEAYSRASAAWARGPSRVYARLAQVLVESSPVPLAGRCVCEVGSGTGVASAALLEAGASVIASDFAPDMLRLDRAHRPPAVAADATALPFPDGAFGGVVAAYCYNHLLDPAAGLREAMRISEPGSPVLASAYAEHDGHPVKDAVEAVLTDAGWTPPPFYVTFRAETVPKLATVERARDVAARAGLHDVEVRALEVPFPDLSLDDIIEWRMGMAQVAWFVDALSADARERAVAQVRERVGRDAPPLVRSVIHIAGRA